LQGPAKKDDKKPAAPAKKDDKKPVTPAKKDDKKPAAPAKKDDTKPAAAGDRITVTALQKAAIERLVALKWNKNTYDVWKLGASMCFYRQMDLVKGAMCSYCLNSENALRWADQNKIYVSTSDYEGWSAACYEYLTVSRTLVSIVQDIQELFQAQPKDVERPTYIKPKPIANEADYKEILKDVASCKENSTTCESGQASIAKVFAMSVLPRMDLENFKITKEVVNLILHMDEKPEPKKKSRRLDYLYENMESSQNRVLQSAKPAEPA